MSSATEKIDSIRKANPEIGMRGVFIDMNGKLYYLISNQKTGDFVKVYDKDQSWDEFEGQLLEGYARLVLLLKSTDG